MDPRHSTLDPQHVTLDPRHLDQQSALGNEYNQKLPREGSVGKLVNTATYDCCEPSYLASVSIRCWALNLNKRACTFTGIEYKS